MNSTGISVNYVHIVRRTRWYLEVKGRKELHTIISVIIGLIPMFI